MQKYETISKEWDAVDALVKTNRNNPTFATVLKRRGRPFKMKIERFLANDEIACKISAHAAAMLSAAAAQKALHATAAAAATAALTEAVDAAAIADDEAASAEVSCDPLSFFLNPT